MEPVPVAIIACPGPLRKGLRILLRTLTNVSALHVADNLHFLLTKSMSIAPSVIVWDWSCLPQKAEPGLTSAQARWPCVRTLALVADDEQGELALRTGVDVVVTKGTPATDLLTAVTALLHETQAGHDSDPASLPGGNTVDQPPLWPSTPSTQTVPMQA